MIVGSTLISNGRLTTQTSENHITFWEGTGDSDSTYERLSGGDGVGCDDSTVLQSGGGRGSGLGAKHVSTQRGASNARGVSGGHCGTDEFGSPHEDSGEAVPDFEQGTGRLSGVTIDAEIFRQRDTRGPSVIGAMSGVLNFPVLTIFFHFSAFSYGMQLSNITFPRHNKKIVSRV